MVLLTAGGAVAGLKLAGASAPSNAPDAVALNHALGSAAGAQAYARWGWTGATLVAAAFPVLGLLFWLASRRHEAAL